jgi:nicotinamide mononucleotide (NMN) deamidase PncC
MDFATRHLIEALHATPHRCVLAATGGGSGAAALLLNVPGASRTVLEVVVPYDEQALVAYLGRRPEQFCSAATSRALAEQALERARRLAPGAAVVGAGCTASLATDRPKRGDHRFHVSVHTNLACTTYTLTLTKGARDREAEEAVLDAVLLNGLAEAFGVAERLPSGLLAGEELQVDHAGPSLLARFFAAAVPAVCALPDGRVTDAGPPPAVLLPGSFNPAHRGHWELAAAAARQLGAAAAFELSVANVDKPPLEVAEVRRRLGQFTWRAPLWLTRAPTFVEKAALFPGTTFVVGADTAARIVAPRYYAGGEAGRSEGLAGLRRGGCRFLVAGRVDASGQFLALEDLAVPADCGDLFSAIPNTEFRLDLSSTQLRDQGGP